MEGKLTVYFDDPFWVGVYEKLDESDYRVARVVFGSEPTDAALYQFILEHYDAFRFGRGEAILRPDRDRRKKNFKRALREVRKAMQAQSVGTRAQQAMKLSLTETKQERRKISRQERTAEAERRFREQQQKKKEKHRGH